MSNIKSNYDQSSAFASAHHSGIGLNEQPPWMTNTTPKAQLASVGVSMVENHPNLAPKDVRMAANWLPKGK